jgi:5-histidylcysteine sulfoxide synthase/putative 4-mercaptohistidine N1-methyltranferase
MRNDSRLLFPRTPDLRSSDADSFRATLGAYFHSTFSAYESLFEALVDEDSYRIKPISLRHPLIFYYGHTATFFTNKLLLAGLISERVNPRFESMFAVGVDEMSWDDLNEAHYDWPTAAEVRAYRDSVRAMVDRIIREAPLQMPVDWDNPWWALIMGVEHERIHLETSTVLIRQHALGRVRPVAGWAPDRSGLMAAPTPADAPINRLVAIPAGGVRSGKAIDDALYGWDNEYGRREVALPAFEAASMLVSNAEYLAFVEAGGYADAQWWDEEGEGWRRYSRATAPTFWVRDGAAWKLRLMTEEVAMPWSWPVEVNCLEARAFCRWKSAQTGRTHRLPTEDEWYRLYDVAGIAEVPHDTPAAANLHLDHGASSCPVDRHAQGDFFDVVGNVWQWTETPIYPFEGFRVHDIYDDFSTPTFDGRHNLMKGGSWASCGNESIRASRYAFRRHFFQHAGLRYVVTDTPAVAPNVYYESDRQLSEYAEFHYGDECFGVPNFPKALAEIAIAAMGNRTADKALDLGCATGRASFELARHFGQVTGVDFSARFINAGVQLRDTGELRYQRVEEGELVSYQTRTLAALDLVEVAGRVDFMQGDACNLKTVLTGYDLILAANLIDRLYDPRAFLDRVHERLKVGGILMLTSPYTWLEEHTARENWLGGFKKDGENWTTLDALKAVLAPHFRLLGEPLDVPFAIRETRRKHQHTIAEASLWERIR